MTSPRVGAFCDAYGIHMNLHDVPALVAEWCRLTTSHIRHLAAQGTQPQLDWVTAGMYAADTEHADWIDRNGANLLQV